VGIASAEAFGTTTVSPGAVTLAPTGIASAEAFGTAKLNLNIVVTGIPSAEAFGTAMLKMMIDVPGIPSAEAFGAALITLNITTTGIPSAEAFGTAIVTAGQTVAPTGIPSAEAFGTALITIYVSPTGIPSGEVFGIPFVEFTPQTIIAGGITSAEAFGTATISMGAITIAPSGITSAEAFGTAIISGGLVVGYRKAIHDTLINLALAGSFPSVKYVENSPVSLQIQGSSLTPRSVEANEIGADWSVDRRLGRQYSLDRRRWEWLLILRFDQEVLLESFEEMVAEDPPCILRDGSRDRNVRLHFSRATYTHPPRMSAANGTEVRYRVDALLSPL
jgi:hypothetical protein